MTRSLHISALGLWLAAAVTCSCSSEEGPASVLGVERTEPTGALVAGGVVPADGGTLVVTQSGAEYAGATIQFAASVFDEPTRVEVVRLRHTSDADEDMPALLAVVAERAFGSGEVTVRVLRESPILAVVPEAQDLVGYARGTWDWVPFEPTEGVSPLTGDLATLRAAADTAEAAGRRVVGENTDTAAAAVGAGATAVSLGVAALGYAPFGGGSELLSGGPAALTQRLAAGEAFVLSKSSLPLRYLWLSIPSLRGADSPPELSALLCAGDGSRVLLTHGVLSHTDSFEAEPDLIAGLTDRGHRVGRLVYPSGYRIDENGAAFAALVADARAGCGGEPAALDVLGHSMGGLVLRSAVQHHGMVVQRLVMLSTPNDGGKWTGWIPDTTKDEGLVWLGELNKAAGSDGDSGSRADGALHTLQKTAPGMAIDLLQGSDFLNALNVDAKVAPHADRYVVVAGWSDSPGALPNDGLVDVRSALLLDLPAGHEHYFAAGDNDESVAYELSGEVPDDLEGTEASRFGHSPIHEEASTNGVLDHIAAILAAAP